MRVRVRMGVRVGVRMGVRVVGLGCNADGGGEEARAGASRGRRRRRRRRDKDSVLGRLSGVASLRRPIPHIHTRTHAHGHTHRHTYTRAHTHTETHAQPQPHLVELVGFDARLQLTAGVRQGWVGECVARDTALFDNAVAGCVPKSQSSWRVPFQIRYKHRPDNLARAIPNQMRRQGLTRHCLPHTYTPLASLPWHAAVASIPRVGAAWAGI